MFTEEILQHLSYKCGCPLDIRESMGVVNGICPKHPKNKLLFKGLDLRTFQSLLKAKKKKLENNKPENNANQ